MNWFFFPSSVLHSWKWFEWWQVETSIHKHSSSFLPFSLNSSLIKSVCGYVCKCMHLYKCLFTCVHICICLCLWVHQSGSSVHVPLYINVSVFVCTHICRKYIYVCMCFPYVCIWMQVCMCVYEHKVSTWVFADIYVCIHTCGLYMNLPIHKQMTLCLGNCAGLLYPYE